MKIVSDPRIVCHFFDKEEAGIYTMLFPANHSLQVRLAHLEFICDEVRRGIFREEEAARAKEAEEKRKALDEAIEQEKVVDAEVEPVLE